MCEWVCDKRRQKRERQGGRRERERSICAAGRNTPQINNRTEQRIDPRSSPFPASHRDFVSKLPHARLCLSPSSGSVKVKLWSPPPPRLLLTTPLSPTSFPGQHPRRNSLGTLLNTWRIGVAQDFVSFWHRRHLVRTSLLLTRACECRCVCIRRTTDLVLLHTQCK